MTSENKEENRKDRLEAIAEQVKNFPGSCGLYFMKDASDRVLYIGKARNLRSRAGSYFQPSANLTASRGPRIVEMLEKVVKVDYLETANEVDALLNEARLIKDIRPPYNTDLTDGKTFPYLEITTRDDFPGVYITRTPRPKRQSRLFGPFANAKDLRPMLVFLQKTFRFRTCKLDIDANDHKRRFFRPCILYSINQCTAPCADKITKSEYKKLIQDLIRFLRSKRSTVLKQLRKQMTEASENREYEKAVVFRDRIRLIERLDRRGTPTRNLQPELFAADPTEALEKLQSLFDSAEAIRIIEGIDIAHISGAQSVGSLVKFIDGRPFKNGYRRFRIKSVEGIDDYAMIAEVVKRRYKYAMQGEEVWPDLILIDGGLGQLNAAQKALKEMDAPAVRVASIAKKEELIYTPTRDEPIRLSARSPARKLLQYVRDEAHRFAQHYHHILRDKNMLEES